MSTPTRFDCLRFERQGDVWRILHCEDGRESAVGPRYRTKDELLADLDRYGREFTGEPAVMPEWQKISDHSKALYLGRLETMAREMLAAVEYYQESGAFLPPDFQYAMRKTEQLYIETCTVMELAREMGGVKS